MKSKDNQQAPAMVEDKATEKPKDEARYLGLIVNADALKKGGKR